jgi:5'-3' exonuclease
MKMTSSDRSFERIVIDADQMVYSCGFAAEGEPISHTLKLLKNAVNQILKDTSADKYELFISGTGNFREELDFEYKSSRTGRKPSSYEDARTYLKDNWGAVEVDDMEADDTVSIALWKDYVGNKGDKNLCDVILSSPDKDLNNTPGWHYNPRSREIKWVSEEQAHRHFCYQLLRGDPVDTVKGLPYCTQDVVDKYGLGRWALKGCGEKTAKEIMNSLKGCTKDQQLNAVASIYTKWGRAEEMSESQTYDYFVLQGCLLWMVRELDEIGEPYLFDYDHEKWSELWSETK